MRLLPRLIAGHRLILSVALSEPGFMKRLDLIGGVHHVAALYPREPVAWRTARKDCGNLVEGVAYGRTTLRTRILKFVRSLKFVRRENAWWQPDQSRRVGGVVAG